MPSGVTAAAFVPGGTSNRTRRSALSSFETFLREGGERIPRARRAEIEQEIARLRMRVGKVTVRCNVPGAIAFIDDEPVGPTPLTRNVAVGSRRIVVKRDGYGTWTKNVEVASGDDLLFDAMLEGGPPVVAARPESTPPSPPPPPPTVTTTGRFFWEPWAVTGALAAATVTTGILALDASSKLDGEKNRFDVTDRELDKASSRAKTFAVVTDVLFVATLAAAGASLYFTFEPPSWVKAPSASVRIAPTASGLLAVGRF